MLALSGLPITPELSKRFRAVSEQTERGTRVPEFRLWGPERVLESVHGENEGRSPPVLYFSSSNFRPVS